MNIFISNLPFSVTDADLMECFAQYGEVQRAHVAHDRDTGHSRGFGFVEMNDLEAQAAIGELNGCTWHGRVLTVRAATEQPPSKPGSGPRGWDQVQDARR